MTEGEIIEFIGTAFDDVQTMEVDGVTFFFHGEERMLPFATLVTKDNDYDRFSNLDRPGIFRLNFELPKAAFRERFPSKDESHDFTQLDRLFPHPTYGANSWVSIVSPSAETFESLKPLLKESYELLAMRQARKADKAS